MNSTLESFLSVNSLRFDFLMAGNFSERRQVVNHRLVLGAGLVLVVRRIENDGSLDALVDADEENHQRPDDRGDAELPAFENVDVVEVRL